LKEGKPPLFVQIEAVTAASGQECHVAIIDISKRRQLEEKLEILHNDLAVRAAELAAANIELEAFNYTVSHDLRRPLTAINSYCQMVRNCGATNSMSSAEDTSGKSTKVPAHEPAHRHPARFFAYHAR